MTSLVPGMLVLGAAALAACWLAWARTSPAARERERRSAARALAAAAVLQGLHFAEEAVTGFPDQLASVLGTPVMPQAFFIAFNLAWLAIWAASVPGLGRSYRGAFFAAWFLAIAGMANGILHPLLALLRGGYFPGLITSPLIGVAAWLLWRHLDAATRDDDSSPA